MKQFRVILGLSMNIVSLAWDTENYVRNIVICKQIRPEKTSLFPEELVLFCNCLLLLGPVGQQAVKYKQ